MTTSPSKSALKSSHLADPSTIPLPASPQKPRTVRRLQSHNQLSSNSPSLITQQRQQQQQNQQYRQVSGLTKKESRDNVSSNAQTQLGNVPSRTRAHSDAPASMKKPSTGRRPYGLSNHGRKSSLEVMLREGPTGDNLEACLNDLRYKILTSKVDAYPDGMSDHRIYLWLALLNIPPFSTDSYIALVRRGRSPVHQKISNDTFRTLATDPLFKRRVTDASITRVLNATAWTLHDAKKTHASLPPTTDIPNPTDPAAFPQTAAPESALYVQGMNVLSAPFLYASRSETEAFALFHTFVTTECPAYITPGLSGVHRACTLVDRCLTIIEPRLANYLILDKGMRAELYAFPSLLTFCACTPPLPEVLHLWDFLFAYGPHLNVLCVVAQLLGLKDELLRSTSPTKILRSFPQLNAEKIIGLTLLALKKIPDELYEELVMHAK